MKAAPVLRALTERVLSGQGKRGGIPPLWDGQAAERIADVVMKEGVRANFEVSKLQGFKVLGC
jgi:hypothetical protein